MGDAIVADKRIQLFGSKEYHFLSWLKSQERETSRGAAVNFSQEEIAAEYGSYHITETGNAVIQKMEKIEQIVAGGTVCKSLD